VLVGTAEGWAVSVGTAGVEVAMTVGVVSEVVGAGVALEELELELELELPSSLPEEDWPLQLLPVRLAMVLSRHLLVPEDQPRRRLVMSET
jgi:hypothetical protein